MTHVHHDPVPPSRVDVVVLGGGLAGLVAATHAARAGARVLVIERGPVLGGRARSTTADGFTLNLGAHALYTGGAATAGLAELGVPVEGARPPGDRGELDGRLVPLPQDPIGLLRAGWLGLRGRAQAARVLAATMRPPAASLDHVSWGDHVRAHASDPRARQLLEAAGRVATYSGDEGISARAVFTNIRAATKGGVRYLDGGWQRLVDGVADAARRAGVVVWTGAGTPSLSSAAQGWTVRAGERRVTSPAVVVAVGTPRAARGVLADVADAALLADLHRRVPMRVAALDVTLRRLPRPDRPFALGLDAPTYLAVHSETAALAPPGGAVVHLARYLRRDEQAGTAERTQLEGLLDRVQPGWRDEVVDARFLPDMTVVGDLPLAAHGGLEGRVPVEVAPGLQLAGDWVGPEGLLTDTVFASARVAGRAAARHAAAHGVRSGEVLA